MNDPPTPQGAFKWSRQMIEIVNNKEFMNKFSIIRINQ
jgi:hypothetical protein